MKLIANEVWAYVQSVEGDGLADGDMGDLFRRPKIPHQVSKEEIDRRLQLDHSLPTGQFKWNLYTSALHLQALHSVPVAVEPVAIHDLLFLPFLIRSSIISIVSIECSFGDASNS